MNVRHIVRPTLCLAALISIASIPSPAQQPAPAAVGATPLMVRKISGSKMQTPEYSLRKNQFAARTRDWFQVITAYDTDPDWIDEATFTYYVLTKSKDPKMPPYSLFRGEVSYINIQKGKHQSDMFIHPSTLARYGDVERVAVLVKVGGRLVARESYPTVANALWYEQLSPVDGYVLNRLQTPFAMIAFDDYEAIKPK